MYEEESMAAEENLRREFLSKDLEKGVQFIQLPCPEFTLYGANRWGHTKNQFDNPFFIEHCRKLLQPIINQLKEYLKNSEKFNILGFIRIDGSPSCGADYTCFGSWGGNLSGRKDLDETIATVVLKKGKGVFFDVLSDMLKEEGISVDIIGLYAEEPHRIMRLFDKCK